MKKTTVIGVVFSAAWFAVVGWKLADMQCGIRALSLNEFGDFLAGAIAPVAFVWLVLGYFQQGKELGQNTESLKMQAEELRVTAQSTQALAEQSADANEIARQEIKRAIDNQLKESDALFVFDGASISGGTHRISLRNDRNTALRVVASLSDAKEPDRSVAVGTAQIVRNGESFKVIIKRPDSGERKLAVDYYDVNGFKRRTFFTVLNDNGVISDNRSVIISYPE